MRDASHCARDTLKSEQQLPRGLSAPCNSETRSALALRLASNNCESRISTIYTSRSRTLPDPSRTVVPSTDVRWQ